LSRQLLEGHFQAGDVVVLDVADDELVFTRKGGYLVGGELFVSQEEAVAE
jgi:hypothetical protein